MSTVTQPVAPVAGHPPTSHYLEALHHYGFTVTIHSPRTSPDALYMVSAYGYDGEEPEAFRESAVHLHDAIKAVAWRLGRARLGLYVKARSLAGELG